MRLIIYISLLSFAFTNKTYAITINWDGGGDYKTWTDPLNWDCDCLPGVNDFVVINTVIDTVEIPTGASVHVNEILVYWSFTVSTGATLVVDDKIRLWFGSDFINNGTITINGEGLYVTDTRYIINNGAINFNGTMDPSIDLSSSGMDTISFINNGSLNWNFSNFGFLYKLGKTGFVNQLSGSINSASILNNAGTFVNYGIITTNKSVSNVSSFTNESTGKIYCGRVGNGGNFTNNGSIVVENEGTLFCISNGGIWTSNGSIEVTGKNIVENSNEMHLNGPVVFNADLSYDGLVNDGNLFFGGTENNTQLNCKWTNNAGKVMTIETCENVIHNGPFINHGTLYNYGVFRHTHNEIPILGSFSNAGIFHSNVELIGFPPPTMPDPSVNYGIHLKK